MHNVLLKRAGKQVTATKRKGRPVAVGADGLSSRMRMINEAEQLFADRGIDGVSLREIVQASGQGNSNAVVYHFGSKDGLVFAIFEHRVGEMEGPRSALLAEARRNEKLDDIPTLLAILFRPYLDLTDSKGRHNYAAFMAEYLVRFRPSGFKHAGDTPDTYFATLSETRRLIAACTPGIPAAIAQNRLELFHLMFFNMVTRWDNTPGQISDRIPLDMLVDDVIDMASAAFLLPSPGPVTAPSIFDRY